MPRPTYVNANVNRANYNSATPIAWNNSGGDWWDAAYTANGSTPWAVDSENPVVDNDTPRPITFNVTTLFQAIYDNPNHLSAVIVCATSGGITEWATADNADSAKRPKIVYDGGAATAITEDTGIQSTSAGGLPTTALLNVTPDLGTSSYNRIILNVPPPVTRPTSATLTLYTTAQFGNLTNQVFWLRYPPESAPSAITYTYSRPSSDVTTQWTPSTAGPHYALINETTYNDANYIYATAASQTDEVGLQAMSIPTAGTSVLVNYRVQGITGGGKVTVSLYTGTTLVKADVTKTANSVTTEQMVVTSAEWGAVSVNWSDMRLRFVSS
jgi:hypothetical protein